ncbi:hypothetical protein [Telluria aromaticivorans]|uniref:Uncharacterized protein n=1 Tax=Telluria aromaticivorans TaxID=2725995 RepID=A0A7Y2P298_9BURK|nr:hypothetical protein [Telluria aromaticivorans]NNG25376.1 hypothetical protein [Telluria aromaticivorans]
MKTMIPTDESEFELEKRIDEIVSHGPSGAFAVAGLATAIVVAMFFIFYFVVYLPRGTVQ